MDRKELMALFNRRPRIGALATAGAGGDVNAAVFGSPQMIDENTIVMGIGKNRSYNYLKENPKAVFILMAPGSSPLEWKGVRVYLEAAAIEITGETLEGIRAQIARVAGEKSAKAVHAAVKFRITEVRPLIDSNP
ncbi:MAG: pyridoxamine 5'-phosphate oxidase family protein [Thermodesulfobacteriota bacterium]